MKQFLTFVRKEFRHILRDPRTMLILLGIPVVQIILFGFALTTEVRNIRLGVVAPAREDEVTLKLVDRFASNAYFSFVGTLPSGAAAEAAFRDGRVDMVAVFENNFGESLLHTGRGDMQLLVDGTDPNTATIMANYAAGVVASAAGEATVSAPPPMTVSPEIRLLYNPQMKSAYNFVPGVMGLIFTLICAMMTAISIVREKETGTMELLLASPVRPLIIILSKAVPYLVLSLVNLATILLLSVYVLGVPVAGSLGLLLALTALFIAVSLALGLLISTVAANQVMAMLISGMGLMMPVMLLSGLIFPVESMPWILRLISNVLPARWFIEAVRKVMIEGLGVEFIVRELAILTGMGALLIFVSFKKFKIRLS